MLSSLGSIGRPLANRQEWRESLVELVRTFQRGQMCRARKDNAFGRHALRNKLGPPLQVRQVKIPPHDKRLNLDLFQAIPCG